MIQNECLQIHLATVINPPDCCCNSYKHKLQMLLNAVAILTNIVTNATESCCHSYIVTNSSECCCNTYIVTNASECCCNSYKHETNDANISLETSNKVMQIGMFLLSPTLEQLNSINFMTYISGKMCFTLKFLNFRTLKM